MRRGRGRSRGALTGSFVAAVALTAGLFTIPGASADPTTPIILFGMTPGTRGSQTQQQVVMSLEARAGRQLPGIRDFDVSRRRDAVLALVTSAASATTPSVIVDWRSLMN